MAAPTCNELTSPASIRELQAAALRLPWDLVLLWLPPWAEEEEGVWWGDALHGWCSGGVRNKAKRPSKVFQLSQMFLCLLARMKLPLDHFF